MIKNVKKQSFEFVILTIFLFEILRSNNFASVILISLVLFGLGVFGIYSFFSFKYESVVRLSSVLFIVIVLFVYILRLSFSQRDKMHDGAIQTEIATEAILKGQNPYSISYKTGLQDKVAQPSSVVFDHYVYSPFLFLVNIPFFLISKQFFAFFDFRLTLFFFYLLAGGIGIKLVSEKILFTILFFLNPVLLLLTFSGASEIVLIFLTNCAVFAMSIKKDFVATILIALAFCSKILFAPFVLAYFVYLFFVVKDSKKYIENVLLFLIINCVIYLPFIFWNFADIVSDIWSYPMTGGGDSHVIAGFFGVGPTLANLGIISNESYFPFFIFQIILALFLLYFGFGYFKKSHDLDKFCYFAFFSSIALLVFSRIVQTNYFLLPISVLVLGTFLYNDKNKVFP